MGRQTRIKVCGFTGLQQACEAVEAGVDVLGLNFWPSSSRYCEPTEARKIIGELEGRARIVGIFVDSSVAEIQALRIRSGLRWVQLHGAESPQSLEELLPHAYKAIHLEGRADVSRAGRFGGEEILVDARLPGLPGGTGVVCDWELAAELSAGRKLWLAGGLKPKNVADAVLAVRPYGVDVASGVERSPGDKDRQSIVEFVREVRRADRESDPPKPGRG